MTGPHPDPQTPIPPIPAGPLNAPIHGPRLPGQPQPWQNQLPAGSAPLPPAMALRPAPAFAPTLPIEATDYPRFWRTPAWKWWRPVVGLGLVVLLGVLVPAILYGIALGIDAAAGRVDITSPDFNPMAITPLGFLANNLGLAALIPIAFLVSWLVFGQRPGWIASVAGTMRWGWLGRSFLIVTPIWLIYSGIETYLMWRAGELDSLAFGPDTWLLVFGILLTTPFQAAGEEFGFRGAVNRGLASFFGNAKVGPAVGAIVSSLVFTGAHAAADLWLNLFYFTFGMAACYVTWRTGGLEGAIAIHVVNNLFGEIFLPFSDISKIFERDAGAADATVLIGLAAVLLASALLVWQAKREGLATTAAPGESMARALSDQHNSDRPLAPPPASGQHTFGQPAGGHHPSAAAPLVNPRPWESAGRVGPVNIGRQ